MVEDGERRTHGEGPHGRPATQEGPGLLAGSVHHIVELEDGGAPRDQANLMSLCRSHHSVIHAQRRDARLRNQLP
jgi:hypothetical protein